MEHSNCLGGVQLRSAFSTKVKFCTDTRINRLGLRYVKLLSSKLTSYWDHASVRISCTRLPRQLKNNNIRQLEGIEYMDKFTGIDDNQVGDVHTHYHRQHQIQIKDLTWKLDGDWPLQETGTNWSKTGSRNLLLRQDIELHRMVEVNGSMRT